jgi:hypothetical protein
MKANALSSGQRQLSLLALNLCVLGAGTGLGAVMPLMALRLAARGASATVIGLNSAMPPLAILLVGPFMPALLTRLGPAAGGAGYGLDAGAAQHQRLVRAPVRLWRRDLDPLGGQRDLAQHHRHRPGTAIDLVGPEGLVAVIAIAAAALLLLWVRLGASERRG